MPRPGDSSSRPITRSELGITEGPVLMIVGSENNRAAAFTLQTLARLESWLEATGVLINLLPCLSENASECQIRTMHTLQNARRSRVVWTEEISPMDLISCSDLVVHSFSTVGVLGPMMGKVTVNVVPEGLCKYYRGLYGPDHCIWTINDQARSVDDLAWAIRLAILGGSIESNQVPSGWIDALGGLLYKVVDLPGPVEV